MPFIHDLDADVVRAGGKLCQCVAALELTQNGHFLRIHVKVDMVALGSGHDLIDNLVLGHGIKRGPVRGGGYFGGCILGKAYLRAGQQRSAEDWKNRRNTYGDLLLVIPHLIRI